jgi:hypothetical protein
VRFAVQAYFHNREIMVTLPTSAQVQQSFGQRQGRRTLGQLCLGGVIVIAKSRHTPRKGYQIRGGLSISSSTSLEYWIARGR